jgi:hypothetical protein
LLIAKIRHAAGTVVRSMGWPVRFEWHEDESSASGIDRFGVNVSPESGIPDCGARRPESGNPDRGGNSLHFTGVGYPRLRRKVLSLGDYYRLTDDT